MIPFNDAYHFLTMPLLAEGMGANPPLIPLR